MAYKGWTDRENLDWNKIDATAPPRLDRDIYYGKIVSAEAKRTKTDKPSVAIRIEATTRYENEKLDKLRPLFDNLVFTQDGAFKAKQICEALGIDPPEDSGYKLVKAFADEILGKKLWMLVGSRMYEGKKNNNIERYLQDDDVDEVHAEEIGDRAEEADDDDDAPPRRKSRAAKDDDDDDAPPKRRAAAKDDDDDAPPRRRRPADEEEEVAAKANGKGKGKSEDLNSDAEADEEPPKRRRRRPAGDTP